MTHRFAAKSEAETARSVERLEGLTYTARVRKSIKETFGFLDTEQHRDVCDFAVYEAWMVHRARKLALSEKPKTFEEFLFDFFGPAIDDASSPDP